MAEEYETILISELESGLVNSDALFMFGNSSGKLFKLTKSQFLAFVATNAGVSKTTLNTIEGTPIVINWQNDIDPDPSNTEGLTYAQRHGANIVPVVVAGAELDGGYIPYNTNFSYTGNGSGVQVLTIPDTYTGKITII